MACSLRNLPHRPESLCGLLAVASSCERLSMRGVLEALGFFALVEVLGLAALPLAGLAFGRLPGAGLGFSKPLGLLLLTWLVWMAASVTPVPYGTATILVAAGLLAVAGVT